MREDDETGFVRGGWAARLGIAAMVVLLLGALAVASLADASPPAGSASPSRPL